ncbi:lipopolysaccharide heptosyltransferase I [Hahella sp. CCB-MM4]|uniref:lipopolysaccharide heptosyltransferase I n=1 Tax=Hahella sp. (strain CCB-MM4) TaxID=1926491 RepID=UPI000B9A44A4|nr:lipopolysaccharide heptosyltransferase I [Hahella sp. CCB-MM4]OZG74925.1 lipopolysaccharide heptosyltransferase I [Hahella sp. CCB-MM4]
MRILLIKMSSLGDVIHTLPAITDAKAMMPSLEIDWVVEEAFAEIPSWHKGVNEVIPIALRRWRKNPLKAFRSGEWKRFKSKLESRQYDLVIDAQGLLKSALVAKLVGVPVLGYDSCSIREPVASLFYNKCFAVSRSLHAVERMRHLFSVIMGYGLSWQELDYGIVINKDENNVPYIVFLHGTTWQTKHLPEDQWKILAERMVNLGFEVRVLWGNSQEKERADRLGEIAGVRVMPKMSLREVASLLKGASAVISVDTGLGHLAAALGCPLVALYGPTSARLTGIYGRRQVSISAEYHCAPCMKRRCRYQQVKDDFEFAPPCWNKVKLDDVQYQLEQLIAASNV